MSLWIIKGGLYKTAQAYALNKNEVYKMIKETGNCHE